MKFRITISKTLKHPFSVACLFVLIACSPLISTVKVIEIPVLNVTLVTPTPINTLTNTSVPTPTSLFTNTPALFTAAPSLTPTYPLLRIVKGKITRINCVNNDAIKTVSIELEIDGGMPPYDYNTNISVDNNGNARAIVVSADKQYAIFDFHVSKNCDNPSAGNPIIITPIVATVPHSQATNTSVLPPQPTNTSGPPPPPTNTSVLPPLPTNTSAPPPPQPTDTPDFPQKECNDNYDNDGDGLIDGADPECRNPSDDDEGA